MEHSVPQKRSVWARIGLWFGMAGILAGLLLLILGGADMRSEALRFLIIGAIVASVSRKKIKPAQA